MTPMNSRRMLSLTLSLCLVASAGLFHLPDEVTAAVLEVGPGMEYETIGSALENATDGDTILVHQGIYHENLIVDKIVELRGVDTGGVVIDGSGLGTTVDITAHGVLLRNISALNSTVGVRVGGDNVTIENCEIHDTVNALVFYENTGGYGANLTIGEAEDGVLIWYSRDTYLSNITVHEPVQRGVRLVGAREVLARDMHVTNPGYHPVYICGSIHVTVEDSIFTGGEHGLFLFDSQSVTLSRNHMAAGMGIHGTSPENFGSHHVEHNTVNGGELYYFRDSSGLRLSDLTGQIILVNVTHSVVDRCMSLQLENGITMAYSRHNLLVGNTFMENFQGMRFIASTGNTLHHNNFINNTRQVHSPDNSPMENQWTDSLGGGNHWSDYTGDDDGSGGGHAGDGVGDTRIPHPFQDKGGGYHRLDPEPLMNPVSRLSTSIPVDPGWNFVSYGVVTPYLLHTEILESLDGKYDKLFVYDATVGTWSSYVPGRAEHYNHNMVLDRSMGFWIHMWEFGELEVEGVSPARTAINLRHGWNMVGMPSRNVIHGEGLPEGVTVVGFFNHSMEYNMEYRDVAEVELVPDYGYMLKVDTHGTVVWNVAWNGDT